MPPRKGREREREESEIVSDLLRHFCAGRGGRKVDAESRTYRQEGSLRIACIIIYTVEHTGEEEILRGYSCEQGTQIQFCRRVMS